MNPQLTPEQQREFENALKIGDILASSVTTINSPRIRINPRTAKEAAGFYATLGAKKPFLQSNDQFLMNCLLYSAETFAACSKRIILCYHLSGREVMYWYGNGNVKAQEPIDNVKLFLGDNNLMFASILVQQTLYTRLRPFLKSQSQSKENSNTLDEFIVAVYGNPPPAKRANVQEAAYLAFNELLLRIIDREEVWIAACELSYSPVPYSTHDLALSAALRIFRQPEYKTCLKEAQMQARVNVLHWLSEGLVVPVFVESFEDTLYKLYKP